MIDALHLIAARVSQEKRQWESYLAQEYGLSLDDKRLFLVTGHRRENFGEGFENICWALRDIAEHFPGVHIVYPVHLNPNVQRPVYEILNFSQNRQNHHGTCDMVTANGSRISLLPPLDYAPFVYLLNQSYLVLTDSGGIQEEAPALGKPVLVMRDVTERPEGVWAGTVKLVGTKREDIYLAVQDLLVNPESYQSMAQAVNPYGDGQAAVRIADIITGVFSYILITWGFPPQASHSIAGYLFPQYFFLTSAPSVLSNFCPFYIFSFQSTTLLSFTSSISIKIVAYASY